MSKLTKKAKLISEKLDTEKFYSISEAIEIEYKISMGVEVDTQSS